MDRYHHVLLAPGARFVPAEIAVHTAPIFERVLFDEVRRLNLSAGWLLREGTEKEAEAIGEIANQFELAHRHVITEGSSTKVQTVRTIRISLEGDRIEVITPQESRWIALSTLRAIDVSLAAVDAEDDEIRDPSQKRAQVLRSLAELLMTGSPAGDLLERISESPILDPQPRVFLLGPDGIAWSLDRATVFPELATQGAVQSLANLLRFTGMLIGSTSDEQTTPETRWLWQNGNLDCIRRDSPEEQQARIDAIHTWTQDGGTLGPQPETR